MELILGTWIEGKGGRKTERRRSEEGKGIRAVRKGKETKGRTTKKRTQ